MRLWLSVMGCCVFAYLSWRSVGREVLDVSGKVISCMGCCGLAAFSPVVWWCPECLPAISSCQWCVGGVVDGFWSVELSRTCREQSVAQLTAEHGVVHPKDQLSPSFAIFLLSQLPVSFRYSPKTWRDWPRPHQDGSWKCWSSALPGSPSLSWLAGRRCFPSRHIFPCHCLPVPVLWLLRHHFTCTFPSQEGISTVWCRAETCDFTEMPRVSNVPSSGMVWSAQNKGNPPPKIHPPPNAHYFWSVPMFGAENECLWPLLPCRGFWVLGNWAVQGFLNQKKEQGVFWSVI